MFGCFHASFTMLQSYCDLSVGSGVKKEGVSFSFDTTVVLRQGCTLRSLMFTLLVNNLPDSLGQSN